MKTMSEEGRQMKWEYKVEFDVKPEKLMLYGKLGWDLVTILTVKKQIGGLFVYTQEKYVFKRKLNLTLTN